MKIKHVHTPNMYDKQYNVLSETAKANYYH